MQSTHFSELLRCCIAFRSAQRIKCHTTRFFVGRYDLMSTWQVWQDNQVHICFSAPKLWLSFSALFHLFQSCQCTCKSCSPQSVTKLCRLHRLGKCCCSRCCSYPLHQALIACPQVNQLQIEKAELETRLQASDADSSQKLELVQRLQASEVRSPE